MRLTKIYPPYLLIFLCLVLFLGACRAKKIVPIADIDTAEKDHAAQLASIKQSQVNFNTLTIKSKALLKMAGSENEVTINFRIAKDQKIWISVTAIAGLEVARINLTPDSIFIINRLESTYTKKPFSFIANYTNDQINFGTLQAVLVGNIWNEVFSQKPNIELLDNKLQLKGRSGSLAYQIKLNEIIKVSSALLQDTLSNQQLAINYSDFFVDAGLVMPHQLNLESLSGTNAIRADLKYIKIEKDIALDFPFSVPKRFSVKN